MTVDPLGQCSQDRPTVGRNPALALVTGRAHRNHQVLYQKGLMPLEAAAGWDLGIDHRLFNTNPGCDLTPAGSLLVFGGWYRRATLVHAARFNVWTTLQTFQTSNLFALFGDRLLQGGDLGKQFDQQSLKLWTA